MQEKSLKLKQTINWLPLILLVVFFLVLIIFNLVNWLAIISLIVVYIGYIFFNKQLWLILLWVIPVMVFGQFMYFEVRPGWIYETSLTEVMLLMLVVIFLVTTIFEQRFLKIKIDNISFLLFLYLLVGLISFFGVANVRMFVGELKVIVFSMLAYWLSLNLLDSVIKIKKLIYSLAALVFILSLQVFWKIFSLGSFSKMFMDRSTVTIPIGAIAIVSATLSLLLPLLLAFYFSIPKENKNRNYILFAFLTGLIAILLIMGKAAIIALLVGLFYLFIKLKHKRLAFVLVCSAFILVNSIIFAPYVTGLITRVAEIGVDKNTDFRKLEYQIGWKIIGQHPWFGVGLGQQPGYYQNEFGFEYKNLVNNFFMQSLIDLGVVGLLLVIFLVRKIIIIATNLKKAFIAKNIIVYGFIASLLAAFVNGLLEVTIFGLYYAILFWIIIGALVNLQKNQESI